MKAWASIFFYLTFIAESDAQFSGFFKGQYNAKGRPKSQDILLHGVKRCVGRN